MMDVELEAQINVLNNFQVFIPIAGDADLFVFTQTTSPSFGLTLTRIDTRESYHYQIQMLQDNGSSEDLITTGLVWAKRTPYQFQKKENTNIVEALLCRLRITTGVFDFRRIKQRSIRFVVRCFSNNIILSTGVSNPVRVLPKKRVADDDADDANNVIVPISWMLEAFESQESQPIEPAVDPQPAHIEQIYSSNEDQEEDSVMANFNESDDRFALSNENEGDSDDLSLVPVSEGGYLLSEHELANINNHSDNYMVLYNGNAEVIGNFRALNFYKASDMRIKEDVRLLMDDLNPRDILLKIDGVAYKFKEGATNAPSNRRFIGYIAQQIESVVPEAVQLIDGILHVDYESLIPYLSESIKQNFKDIKDVKSDNRRIHQIIDMMYAEFVTTEKKKSDTKTSKGPSKAQYRNRSLRWIIGASISVVFLVSVAIAVFFLAPFMNGPQPASPFNPASPSTPQTPPVDPNTPAFYPTSPDQAALVDLYHATQGQAWRVKTSPDRPVCSWGGIVCDGNSRVLEIDLEGLNLYGTIPESIGSLKFLRVLQIGINPIFGTIPASITNLTNLASLLIGETRLNGTVPEGIFSLPFMQNINLNNLPGLSWTIPPQISKLRSLSIFMAYNSGLHGTIPNEISQLKRLTQLMLGGNRLTGTVPSLAETLLSQLYLDGNQLSGSLPELPRLSYFSVIRLDSNNFTGTLENFKYLRVRVSDPEIGFSRNSLTGEFYLPTELFERLGYLKIQHNRFTSLSPLWENITMRADCDASYNLFRCPIPAWFKQACNATCT